MTGVVRVARLLLLAGAVGIASSVGLASTGSQAVAFAQAPPEHPGENKGAEHGTAAAAAHGSGESAAHGEAHGIDVKTLALQLLNFGVLLFLLLKFGGGAVNKALRARPEQLQASLEEAAKVRTSALALLQEQEKRLQNLSQEIDGMRASMKQGAEAERVRLLAAAEERAKRIQAETTFLLDQ